ncbi:helix-turn-helix domain-containing protein [Spirillospora sp. NBC_01491]|uniref:helix-turn-helix domain-containing protein n=1 Tax=Spirillospora sp. NBC_01491 TaxID=2976007 RepID=UPI002E324EFA|nr:helix-turn-helix transcriptional regulator [Spirillospora sp. NBC_01491]
MAVVTSPTVRARRLALELQRLRERSGLGQAEAARRLGWSRSKLSRIEDAATRPADDDVQALLQLYGLEPDRHDALRHLNQDSWQRGWWTAFGDAFTGNYPMLEDQAPEIFAYEIALIPGLLQTPDYARTLIRAVRDGDEKDLDRLVAARMARKAVLERVTPPRLHLVINEAAFHQVVGDACVMRKQTSEVWSHAVERSNVTIQILPFTASRPFGLESSFTLFAFPEDHGLDVGHSEGLLGEWYAESSGQLTQIRVAFDHVRQAALSPEESIAWLAARTRE